MPGSPIRFHLRVLDPGQFNARYHRETQQEAFPALSREAS